MSDDSQKARDARAKAIRAEIDRLTKGRDSLDDAPDADASDTGSSSPRDLAEKAAEKARREANPDGI